MPSPTDELIDLTPHDAPTLAFRAAVYEVLRARGERDDAAAFAAFAPPRATRGGAPITARELHAFYDDAHEVGA